MAHIVLRLLVCSFILLGAFGCGYSIVFLFLCGVLFVCVLRRPAGRGGRCKRN